ncbi:nucleoside triphosphate pyrophosphohydrolase family protein [Paludibacterium yongneupense]|uniref:nucleoside triphosphate pyrophosphohydrolase family protein n=1 Tax=Paludibacterium yongneupense TaxID=400061 RepID=UPI0004148132|nr:nucleoside triphosphate pyrophosphohydrolase family protein [Paludibacterium yongneupense]
MSDLIGQRREFMRRFDLEQPAHPGMRPRELAMWTAMLNEEWKEFGQALDEYATPPDSDPAGERRRMAELTAEGVDLLNVVIGLLLSQGMPVAAMSEAIHAANLAKCADGKVLRRADGKILKPPQWRPADKEAVIRSAQEATGDAA